MVRDGLRCLGVKAGARKLDNAIRAMSSAAHETPFYCDAELTGEHTEESDDVKPSGKEK